jgi:transposase
LTAHLQPSDEKPRILRRHHALHPRPQSVSDPAFTSNNPFFDPRDAVQVKYEMLRRVQHEGETVSRAAAAFGFSRPSYYQAQNSFSQGGLPALLRRRPGPQRAHKLSDEVIDVLEGALSGDPSLSSHQLVDVLERDLGLRVHPRSVERAMARRRKSAGCRVGSPPMKVQLRGEGLGVGLLHRHVRRHHHASGAASGSAGIAPPAAGALATS